MTLDQLTDIREQLVAADDFADLQIVTVRLIDGLIDECDQVTRGATESRALQLLREAFDLLNDRDSRINLQDWNREAKKLLRPAVALGHDVDPRD